MKLLLPIGLTALVGLLVLLIIYLLKPNYQNKMVSSTYIWKLSLKYKKKRIPISKFRNILILICQILVLTIAALIIADPVTVIEKNKVENEKIVILDASSSMRSEYNGETRFERAKNEIKEFADEVFAKNGMVSLIYAGPSATCVLSRESDASVFKTAVDELECSYASANVDEAMGLAEKILDQNADAAVVYFTGTQYTAKGNVVEVRDVSESGEWNAAVLDVRTELIDGVYEVRVDIACYGQNRDIELNVEVTGINGTDNNLTLPLPEQGAVNCVNDEIYTVVYSFTERDYGQNSVFVDMANSFNEANTASGVKSNKFYSYKRIIAYINVIDSIDIDNSIEVYGGETPKIQIEYKSTNWNDFFRQSLSSVGEYLGSERGFDITTITKDNDAEAETSGYDIYLFEHSMPETLPRDGVVIMADPDTGADAGFTVRRKVDIQNWDGDGASLAIGESHPITDGIDPTQIKLSQYIDIDENSLDGYTVLMYYMGSPVVFVKNTADVKIFVLAFDIHKSNLALSSYFPQLMYQMLAYFLPKTFEKAAYDVYEDIDLNARGNSLTVITPENEEMKFDEFPATFTAVKPGTYTVEQTLMSGTVMTEKFYVRIPSEESNIAKVVDVLTNPNVNKVVESDYNYLLIYFAAALFAFAFIEWILQSKSGV